MDTIMESDLAQRLGLPRDEVKRWREKMEVGTDWIKTKPVMWTGLGVQKLEERLGLGGEVAMEKPPAIDADGRREAKVVRSNFRNRRMIEARLSSGATTMVLVRDAGLYIAGQSLEVRRNGDGWMEAMAPRKKGAF